MNKLHGNRGRFCTREEARTVDPSTMLDEPEVLTETLHIMADKAMEDNDDAISGGGMCLLAERQTGVLEYVVLSYEGYKAYTGNDDEYFQLIPIQNTAGRIGGVKDAHNIRKGIRRWCGRNRELIDQHGVFLRVIRDDDDVIKLHAVKLN